MEAIEIKKEEKVLDVDGLETASIEIDEVVQAIRYLIEELENTTSQVKNEAKSEKDFWAIKCFVGADLTQFINMMYIIIRDLERNAEFLHNETSN